MKIKLTHEQLKRLEAGDEIKAKPIRYWSIDDLAKGRGMTQSMVKKCVKNAAIRRGQHLFTKGWTKNRRLRSEARIPTWLYLQPEFQKKYFPENADEHEKAKALEQLKCDFPAFRTY